MPSILIMGKKSLFIKLNGLENKASLAICSKCRGTHSFPELLRLSMTLDPFALCQPMPPGYKSFIFYSLHSLLITFKTLQKGTTYLYVCNHQRIYFLNMQLVIHMKSSSCTEKYIQHALECVLSGNTNSDNLCGKQQNHCLFTTSRDMNAKLREHRCCISVLSFILQSN